MYPLAKFGGNKSFRNGDKNPCVSFYINISEKAELIAWVCFFWDIFKIKNTDLQFWTPRNVESEEEEEENVKYKALYFASKRKQHLSIWNLTMDEFMFL